VLRGRLLATPRREAYKSTSLAAATGANGRWSIALPVPPAQLVFTAVTEGLPERTFAIRGTAASVHARITLAVAGNSFSGTVAPAQPGRSVRLQIRTKRTCSTPPPNGPTICTDEYATVARAPLDAAGSGHGPRVVGIRRGVRGRERTDRARGLHRRAAGGGAEGDEELCEERHRIGFGVRGGGGRLSNGVKTPTMHPLTKLVEATLRLATRTRALGRIESPRVRRRLSSRIVRTPIDSASSCFPTP